MWEYDVVADLWNGPMMPDERPLPRHLHAIAYDPRNDPESCSEDGDCGRTVVHGGINLITGVIYTDTWEWQGPSEDTPGKWLRTAPLNEELLLPRWGHAMAFDPSREKLVLFGGSGWQGANGAPGEALRPFEYSDVWEYGTSALGLAWIERPSPSSPSPVGRWGHAVSAIPGCLPDGNACIAVVGGSSLGKALGDVWLWNGATAAWAEGNVGAGGPRARFGHAVYFDELRSRMVLFAGTGGGAPADAEWWYTPDTMTDTWDLDPTNWTWTETTPRYGNATRPYDPAAREEAGRKRMFARMAWDPRRNRGEMFGGLDVVFSPIAGQNVPVTLGDTWHHRRPVWTSYEARPSPRVNSVLALGGPEGSLLLFGGDDDAPGALNDTWMWNGGSDERNWTEYGVSPTRPEPRWDHALSFDASRQRAVLFGGQATRGGVLGDAWEWDEWSGVWSPVPVSGVSPRRGHAMAWDALGESTLLFGGRSGSQFFSDTWQLRWDGRVWRWLPVEAQAVGPMGRIRHGLATDLDRGRVVMFGGLGPGSEYFGDTWEWDNTAERWLATPPIDGHAPAPRRSHSMTYDPVRGAVIMFGGYTGVLQADLWEWNGASSTWTELAGTGPEARMDGVIAYDPLLRRSVLFGGRGAADRTDNVTWTFSSPLNARPALDPVGSRTTHAGEPVSIDLAAHDDDGDPLTYSAHGLAEGAELSPTTGRFQWTPRADQVGLHTVIVSASDGCASDSERVEITVCQGNCPPVLQRIGSQKVWVGIPFSLQLQATDPEGDPLVFTSAGLPERAVLDRASGLMTWDATSDEAGVYAVRLAVSDGAGTDSEMVRFTVCDGNCPPELDPVGDQSVPVGGTLDLTVTAVDPDDDFLTFEVVAEPHGADFDPAQQRFRWAPAAPQAGTHAVTFRVSDGTHSDEETIHIFVCDRHCPPVFAAMDEQTVAEGERLSFTVAARHANGGVVGYRAEGLPPGAQFNAAAASFAWVPEFNQGGTTYAVTFVASDGRTEASQTVPILVLDVNRPPVVKPMEPARVAAGQELSLEIPAEDPDGYPVVVEPLGRSPAGAQFVGRRLVWTPTQAQIGAHEISFLAVEAGRERLSVEGRIAIDVVTGDAAGQTGVANLNETRGPKGTRGGCGCASTTRVSVPLLFLAIWLAAQQRGRARSAS